LKTRVFVNSLHLDICLWWVHAILYLQKGKYRPRDLELASKAYEDLQPELEGT